MSSWSVRMRYQETESGFGGITRLVLAAPAPIRGRPPATGCARLPRDTAGRKPRKRYSPPERRRSLRARDSGISRPGNRCWARERISRFPRGWMYSGADVEAGELVGRLFVGAGENRQEAGPCQEILDQPRDDLPRRRVVALDPLAEEEGGDKALLRHPRPRQQVQPVPEAEVLQDVIRRAGPLPPPGSSPRRSWQPRKEARPPPPRRRARGRAGSGEPRREGGQEAGEERVQGRAPLEDGAHAQDGGCRVPRAGAARPPPRARLSFPRRRARAP